MAQKNIQVLDQPGIDPSVDQPIPDDQNMTLPQDQAVLMQPTDSFPVVSITPEQEQVAEQKLGPNWLRRVVAGGLIMLSAVGCAAPKEIPDTPTQRDVASVSFKGVAAGLEGDANGLFNTREAVDIPNNEYEKDGGILDAIGGMPNLVVGVPDPDADDVPKGDNWLLGRETDEETTGGMRIEPGDEIPVEFQIPRTETVTTEQTITGGEAGNTQYEADFETDRTTFEQAFTPADQVARETLDLIEQGYSVSSVLVTGFASGEDHTLGGDLANLGEPSANNLDLAGQRAAHGQNALNAAFQEHGVDISNASLMVAGVEVEPTVDQQQQLQSAADTLGITVSELTERFNTQAGSITPEQFNLMTETLTNNRGVMYEIHVSKTEEVPVTEFEATIIKFPQSVLDIFGGSKEEGDWLFRVEIPGEALLLLIALAAGKAVKSVLPSSSRRPNSTPGTNPFTPASAPPPRRRTSSPSSFPQTTSSNGSTPTPVSSTAVPGRSTGLFRPSAQASSGSNGSSVDNSRPTESSLTQATPIEEKSDIGTEESEFNASPALVVSGGGIEGRGFPGGQPISGESAPTSEGVTSTDTIGVPPIDLTELEPYPPRQRQPRGQQYRLPRQNFGQVPRRIKQPRNQNFSKQPGNLSGGSGRLPRGRGGNRIGGRG